LHILRESSICFGLKANIFSHLLKPSIIAELPSIESSFFVAYKTAEVQIKYYLESIGFVLHSELKLGSTSSLIILLGFCLCLVYFPF
jgi:hypothetical protein